MKTKVKNMTGNRGRAVKNQFIIMTHEGKFFQSYETIIAFWPFDGGKVLLDKEKWDYSKTTGKYRNLFLGDKSKAETLKRIERGDYILTNLNE